MRAVLGSILERRKLLAITALVIAFLLALIAWSLGPSTHHVDLPNGALDQPSSNSPSSSAGSPSSSGAKSPTDLNDPLQPTLPESVLLNAAGASRHSVIMEATTNGRILRMAYLVAGGNPERSSAKLVASPLRITTVGRGDSLLAAFAVQASPEDTYLTCKIFVDGKLRSTKTVNGPWKVAVCLG